MEYKNTQQIIIVTHHLIQHTLNECMNSDTNYHGGNMIKTLNEKHICLILNHANSLEILTYDHSWGKVFPKSAEKKIDILCLVVPNKYWWKKRIFDTYHIILSNM